MDSLKIINLAQYPCYLPTLAEWHQQEWHTLNPGETLAMRIARMQPYLLDALIPSTFIAKTDGLLGSAAIVNNDMDSHPELSPWLASVFVAPAYRRQGVGSQLVRYVVQMAKQAGIARLYLFTPDQMAFYTKLGWQAFSEADYHGQQVTLMVIDINSF